MKKFVSPLLLIPLCMMAAGVGYCANASSSARVLDLSPPNFFSPAWQERLQGPLIERDEVTEAIVIITPSPEGPSNTHLSIVGIGSLYWAATHPAQAWRVLLPVQPGDEFDAFTDIKLNCAAPSITPGIRAECL